jgi:hypothetical protein
LKASLDCPSSELLLDSFKGKPTVRLEVRIKQNRDQINIEYFREDLIVFLTGALEMLKNGR